MGSTPINFNLVVSKVRPTSLIRWIIKYNSKGILSREEYIIASRNEKGKKKEKINKMIKVLKKLLATIIIYTSPLLARYCCWRGKWMTIWALLECMKLCCTFVQYTKKKKEILSQIKYVIRHVSRNRFRRSIPYRISTTKRDV